MTPPFPTVYWAAWDADATFAPGGQPPPESEGRLWAVLAFVFYGDAVVLADIAGRGWCIPSGHIEPGETMEAACEREAFEEAGARLRSGRRRLIGCYRLIPRSGARAGQPWWCPVFVAEALGFEPIPPGSESRGRFLAAVEDVADLYFLWDPLLDAVFTYAVDQKTALLPAGTPVAALFEPPSV